MASWRGSSECEAGKEQNNWGVMNKTKEAFL